jgi:hypothetical protein
MVLAEAEGSNLEKLANSGPLVLPKSPAVQQLESKMETASGGRLTKPSVVSVSKPINDIPVDESKEEHVTEGTKSPLDIGAQLTEVGKSTHKEYMVELVKHSSEVADKLCRTKDKSKLSSANQRDQSLDAKNGQSSSPENECTKPAKQNTELMTADTMRNKVDEIQAPIYSESVTKEKTHHSIEGTAYVQSQKKLLPDSSTLRNQRKAILQSANEENTSDVEIMVTDAINLESPTTRVMHKINIAKNIKKKQNEDDVEGESFLKGDQKSSDLVYQSERKSLKEPNCVTKVKNHENEKNYAPKSDVPQKDEISSFKSTDKIIKPSPPFSRPQKSTLKTSKTKRKRVPRSQTKKSPQKRSPFSKSHTQFEKAVENEQSTEKAPRAQVKRKFESLKPDHPAKRLHIRFMDLWTAEEVIHWVRSKTFGHLYESTFQANNITGQQLTDMKEQY